MPSSSASISRLRFYYTWVAISPICAPPFTCDKSKCPLWPPPQFCCQQICARVSSLDDLYGLLHVFELFNIFRGSFSVRAFYSSSSRENLFFEIFLLRKENYLHKALNRAQSCFSFNFLNLWRGQNIHNDSRIVLILIDRTPSRNTPSVTPG